MRAELALVLADPVMVRSPVLARLLSYLVETTIAGQGKSLKSYSVAVDGLGRGPDFDSQVDTYARVQVARLRKALDTFYAQSNAQRSHRLLIVSGSYEVTLVSNDLPDAQSEPRAVDGAPRPPASRFGFAMPASAWGKAVLAAGLLALIGLGVAAALYWRAQTQLSTQNWRTSNIPIVEVTVHDDAAGGGETDLARRVRQVVIGNMQKYEGASVSYFPAQNRDYLINIDLHKKASGYDENVQIICIVCNRVIGSYDGELTFKIAKDEAAISEFVRRDIFRVMHPTGIIHASARKRVYRLDTPYGCWLRFTAQLQNNHTVGDAALEQCAHDWHVAAPNHPIAAALYGWTLTDKSILSLTDSGRKTLLDTAIEALEGARQVNPNSPLLQVATMRAYAVAGDGSAMHEAAYQAIKLNPDNLDIDGVAGLMLALWNDPQGEVLLTKAIGEHFNPPPWYFLGTFIAAMMRDDVGSAGKSLSRLEDIRHSLGIRYILQAAYEAHTGHLERAKVAWGQAVTLQPILRYRPATFFERLPMSVPVRGRLLEWLAPVLEAKAR